MGVSKNEAETNSIFGGAALFEQIKERLRPYHREIGGGVILLLAVITLLSLLSLTGGALSAWWANIFGQLFGWGAVPAAVLLGALGGLLAFGRLKDENHTLPLDTIIGVELLFVVGLALTHLLVAGAGDQAVRLAREGGGGGFVGWGLSTFLIDLIGLHLTVILLLLIGLSALGLMFRLTVTDAARWAELVGDWAYHQSEHLQSAEEDVRPVETDSEENKSRVSQRSRKKQKRSSPQSPSPEQSPPAPGGTATKPAAALPKTNYRLPPLELLAPPTKNAGQNANARYQAQIIEETLNGFGIPAEVVEINSGPTVVQFGLKLGTIERKQPDGTIVQQRIRVRKVVALANDLALALSAAPIRIEAPVPGRPLVGIEAPNSKKTMVTLREVIEDKAFKKGKGALRVALGKGVSGQGVSAPLAEMPHLLIAGATGSGKSVCLNTIITTLLATHAPEQLRFLLIDPKMVELISFNGIPHLIAPVVTDFEQVVGALAWVTREMERRYKLFASTGTRSLNSYNHKVGPKGERLPYMVVVIDELADLMMMAPDEVERHVCRIAQMARATGIHLVIATQRPSIDVVTGLIKANFPTRVAFAVSSQVDSRVILDTPGAERLLGRGDMLYMASDSPKLARLQGCFVSDEEIRNIVDFWKASIGTATPAGASDDDGEDALPWAGILEEAGKDDLLEEAIKLVIESDRASTSLLQRRLGIGYPRASRLMDQLEEEGVIGPARGSQPRQVMWGRNRDEADYDEFENDVRGD